MKLTVVLLCFLLFSCMTPDELPIQHPPLENLLKEDVEKEIENKEYLSALQGFLGLREESPILSDKEKIDFEKRIFSGLKTTFLESIEKKQFSKAYGILLTCQNLNSIEKIAPWDEKKLLTSWADDHAEKGEKLLALLLYHRILKKYEFEVSKLEEILKLSLELDQKVISKEILGLSSELSLPSEYEGMTFESESKVKMLKGTVTVWVDKGVKLENGYGIPNRGLGSGFFIDKHGYLLTNYHVIASEVDPTYEGFSRLYVRLSDNVKERIPAKVVGYDRIFDLALLKIEIEPEYIFPMPSDFSFELAEKVQAIGAPIGLENTLTQGILSNVSRRITQMGEVLQVDAPINKGNSGGPLLNSKDQLLGVVFAGLEMFEGLNFAIPYKYAKTILPRLYQGGEVVHSFFGLVLDELRKNLEIIYVLPGSSSYRAGIKKQDRIVSVNGQSFSKIVDLQNYLLNYPPGCLMKVNIRRGEKDITKYVLLEERPFSPVEEGLKVDKRENLFVPLFGMEIRKVSNFLWETNYIVDRIVTGSRADNSGISVGDPLNLQSWRIEEDYRVALLQMFIKKQKAGYFDSIIQIWSYLETDNFI